MPELIAELAALDGSPREAGDDEIAELDARGARATGDALVSQDHVVQWLRTRGHPRVPTVAGPLKVRRQARPIDFDRAV